MLLHYRHSEMGGGDELKNQPFLLLLTSPKLQFQLYTHDESLHQMTCLTKHFLILCPSAPFFPHGKPNDGELCF